MNILKFKSVAVRMESYKLLKKIANEENRSAGMQITHLVDVDLSGKGWG